MFRRHIFWGKKPFIDFPAKICWVFLRETFMGDFALAKLLSYSPQFSYKQTQHFRCPCFLESFRMANSDFTGWEYYIINQKTMSHELSIVLGRLARVETQICRNTVNVSLRQRFRVTFAEHKKWKVKGGKVEAATRCVPKNFAKNKEKPPMSVSFLRKPAACTFFTKHLQTTYSENCHTSTMELFAITVVNYFCQSSE